MVRFATPGIGLLFVLFAPAAFAQDPVPVTLVLQEGDVPAGETSAVSILNAPFVNGLGQVGFVGGLEGDDRFIWFDDGIIWKNSDAAPGNVLTGAEGTLGISDDGNFIYSPSVDGNDAVWTGDGLLLADGDPIPGVPDQFSSFNSRPQMLPDATAVWVGGLTDTVGGSTQGRALFRSPDTATPVIEIVLQSGDVIDGFPIDFPSGIGFDYDFSDDGAHHIQDLTMDTGSPNNDGFVYVDGALVARESDPTGNGDNWDNFDLMSINQDGNYVFSGNTDGDATTNEFISYNGSIALREGDSVGGVTLTSSASVDGLSINNEGGLAHLWSIAGGAEILFHSPDAANPADGVQLLATGDSVDVDGDEVGDATVADFNASGVIGPGLDLESGGQVFVEVDLLDGEEEWEAIIGLDLPIEGPQAALLLSGIVEGTRAGGTPKAFEFFATADIADLSAYAIRQANNGGTDWGVARDLEAVPASEGDHLTFASEEPEFTAFFGFAPDFTNGGINVNGDDVVGLFFDANGSGTFEDDEIIDVFGELGVDGTGQPWEYTDGWAYRKSGTGPDGDTFSLGSWVFSGTGVISGSDATNDATDPPMPVGTYDPTVLQPAPVAGWRLLTAPGDGVLVQHLADLNLVQGVTGSYPGSDPNLFVNYTGPTSADYVPASSTDQTLNPGRGFIWYLYDDAIFEGGTPPPEFVDIEDFTLPIVLGTTLTDDVFRSFQGIPSPAFYMIGNPFQAAFRLEGVSTQTGVLSTNFHAWNPEVGSYVVLTTSDVVSVWQGVFAEVSDPTDVLGFVFDSGSVVDGEHPPVVGVRTGASFAIDVRLRGTLDGGQPVADLANRIRFEEDAMLAWDRHDGSKLLPPPAEFGYALLSAEGLRNGQPYRQSVRSLPSGLEEAVSIPVAFRATEGGSFEISATSPDLPEGWAVVLRDLTTGARTNLLKSAYAFESGATQDWQDRFEITVSPEGVVGSEGGPAALRLSQPTPNPTSGSTALVLRVAEGQRVTARVYDALGRLISSIHDGNVAAGEEVRLEVDATALAAGTYVVRIEGETFAETRRFAVVR